jgi:PBP1b-binding outer membrane lipoprotein LpoB
MYVQQENAVPIEEALAALGPAIEDVEPSRQQTSAESETVSRAEAGGPTEGSKLGRKREKVTTLSHSEIESNVKVFNLQINLKTVCKSLQCRE